MTRRWPRWLTLLTLLPAPLLAAEDPRVSFLEQEVRNLQRQVLALTRRVDQLDSRPARAVVAPAAPASRNPSPVQGAATLWLEAGKWRQLHPGMSELEVIGLLGPPTSLREDGAARMLLYAMELSGGYLAGSVRVRDGVVTDVRIPALQ